MPANNNVDSILLIGDGLNAINIALSNLMPGTQDYNSLEQRRDKIRERFDFLVRYFFKNNTKRFVKSDSDLARVVEEARKELADLANMQRMIDNATRFLSTVDQFITAIFV